jgi:hypothetical protein
MNTDVEYLAEMASDFQTGLLAATKVINDIRTQHGLRSMSWQTLEADYAETVKVACNPVVEAIGQFGLPGAREAFIATIREMRDRYDGASAAHWLAWDAILRAAEHAAKAVA